ncbi:LysE family translocator [Limobrevibacterium gyesilva]|nr:LysE family translocator [Limobrevibacterium gyesilva]
MNASLSSLLAYGFVLGWSVAWPPGPINAEIARRCLARGFWAGYGLILGATCGDVIWALVVALGIGVLLQGPTMHFVLGVVSVALLLFLAFTFLRGAWRSLGGASAATARFESSRASFALGITLALTSPWNIAFWLAAIGRPEMTQLGLAALLVVVAAVVAAVLTWGFVWSGIVLVLRRTASGRAWDVIVRALTGLLMLYFAATSAQRLLTG